MDVDFMLDDLLETLRPKGRPKGVKDGAVIDRLRTFGEAATALDTMLAANVTGELSVSRQLTADHDDDDEEEEGERASEPGIERIDDTDEEEEAPSPEADDEGEDDVVLIGEPRELDEFDERARDEFDRDFARMLADTKVERKAAPPVFDQAVPMFRKRQQNGEPDEGKMQFMLLSKKGNKPQVGSTAVCVTDRRCVRWTFPSTRRLRAMCARTRRRRGPSRSS